MPVNKLLKLAQVQREELQAMRRACDRLATRNRDLERENDLLRAEIERLGGTVPNEKLTTT